MANPRPYTPFIVDDESELTPELAASNNTPVVFAENQQSFYSRKTDGAGYEARDVMRAATYDKNKSGVVDNSEKLGGESPDFYAKQSDLEAVQADAQSAADSKEPSITAGTTSQYWRGDKTFQPLNKAAVGLSNVDNTSDANKPVSSATLAAINAKENPLTFNAPLVRNANAVSLPNISGTNTGDETLATIQTKLGSTSNLQEGTNQYFTAARVLAVVLSGLSAGANTVISATDTILSAFSKLQVQISALATVARTGNYSDLTNKPTIPNAQIQSDWTQANTSSLDFIKNKPTVQSYFNASGAITAPTKKFIATVVPTTTNGFSINISSAGFTSILGVQVIAMRDASTATSSPNVSIKTVTSTAITVNVTEASTSLVTVLGLSVLGGLPVIFATTTGLTLYIEVTGN